MTSSSTTGSHGVARSATMLSLCGVSMCLLLGTFVLLFVNVPPHSNARFGLHVPSVSLFRSLWGYPELSFSRRQFTVLASFNVIALWAMFLAAIGLANRHEREQSSRLTVLVVFAFACLFNLLLTLLLPPVLSGDVFHYALFGRMVARTDLNPYVVAGSALRQDEFLNLTLWRDMTTPYGPAWTLLSGVVAAGARGSVLLTVLGFKAVAALSNVGCTVLVFQLSRELTGGSGLRPLLAYAWNPLVLIETAGTAHNDVLMLGLALLAVWLAMRGRVVTGSAVALVSVLVKYLSAFLFLLYVPFCLVRAASGGRRTMVSLALRIAIAAVAVSVLLYLPFFSGVEQPTGLLPGLTPSFNPMPNPLIPIVKSFIDGFVLTFAGGSAPARPGELSLWLAFAACLLWLLVKTLRGRTDWIGVLLSFGWLTVAYSYVVFGSSLPWYLISPFGVAAIGRKRTGGLLLFLVCSWIGLAGFILGYATMMPV